MNGRSFFKLTDVAVVACIILLFGSAAIPMLLCSAGRSREAVCRNNLKLIGVGLELWRQNADKYPFADYPSFDGNNLTLDPWLDALMMQNAYTSENLEAHRVFLGQLGYKPEDFIKTVDDDEIFRCPGDQCHPHRINTERSTAWNYNAYEYSYFLSCSLWAQNSVRYDRNPDKQILSGDGLWTWSQNLSAAWIDSPGASFSNPGWWCNTVGYWHKRNSANLLLRDSHIENHRYPPDTTKVFEWESGETLYVIH